MALTGEPRKTNQPFHIDRLPVEVHERIQQLYAREGKTWAEIEAISAEPFGEGKLGIVDWHNLPLNVLELFPDLRIPKSNLQRWYDVRVFQVQQQVLRQSAMASELAEAFTKANIDGDRDAVLNAARDQIFALMGEDLSGSGRERMAKALLALSEVMQTARRNDLNERKVAAEERRIVLLEGEAKRREERMAAETEKLQRKATKGEITTEDIDRLRERVFGLPPKAKTEE